MDRQNRQDYILMDRYTGLYRQAKQIHSCIFPSYPIHPAHQCKKKESLPDTNAEASKLKYIDGINGAFLFSLLILYILPIHVK